MPSLKSLLHELLIFRKHLPKGKVSQQYTDEYNALLTSAPDELDIDLDRFFIKPNDIKRDVVASSHNYLTGESRVGYGLPYVDSNFFMMRLESAIAYLADKLGIENPVND